MYLDRITAVAKTARLIARHGVAAAQWEMALNEAGAFGSASAWPSVPLESGPAWLAGAWEAARSAGAGAPDRCLLSPNQTQRLWRRVIDASDEGAVLISSTGVAHWARLARRSLFEFGLAPRDQGGPDWQGDSAAFLHWNRGFERELEANGWIDPDCLLYALNRLPVSTAAMEAVVLLDPLPLTPELERLEAGCRAAGRVFESVWPDDQRANTRALIAAGPDGELRRAAEWAARRLDRRPNARLAVVIPDLQARRDEAERAFTDRLGAAVVSSTASRSIRDIGLFGAALTALRLLAPGAEFGTLSRWLRSPFFAGPDPERACETASFERALRDDPRAQTDFVTAYRRHGLRREFQRRLPETAASLDACFERLPRRASPTAWAAIWQACLSTLGWQGFETSLPEALRDAWDAALAGFSELTPVTGALTMPAALEELGRIVAAQSVFRPLARTGVHLFSRIEQIGPAYGGAWITGFSDQSWPEPPDQNPLVPWAVRAARGMPGARPDAALAAAQSSMDRLLRRVPEAVFSCPDRVLDQPQVPHPIFSDWAPTSSAGDAAPYAFGLASRIGGRALETLPDPAPPFVGDRIPGGARTLDLQSACPIKAFCVARLGAEPLQPATRGLDARRRGLLVHRALELLFEPADSANELPRDDPRRVAAAVARAFDEGLAPGDGAWQVQAVAERDRAMRLLEGFLEIEAAREAFSTLAVERRTEIEIGGRRLRCRIDRIDRLHSGGDVLLDYKTGKRSVGGWFNERLADCQLPLYAQQAGDTVEGLVVVTLTDETIAYRAVGPGADTFPGRQQGFESDAWQHQLETWRRQLEGLIDEFAGGDVRIRADATEEADGAYAAVTRIRSAHR